MGVGGGEKVTPCDKMKGESRGGAEGVHHFERGKKAYCPPTGGVIPG